MRLVVRLVACMTAALVMVLFLGAESYSAPARTGARSSSALSGYSRVSQAVTQEPCSSPSSPPSPSAGQSFTDATGRTCIQGPVYDAHGALIVSPGDDWETWTGLAAVFVVALLAALLVTTWGRDG